MEFNFSELWGEMGMIPRGVMILLAFMSIVTIAVMVIRLITILKANGQSLRFADVASDALQAHRIDECIEAAGSPAYSDSHVAKVVASGLREFKQGTGDRATLLDNTDRALDRAIDTERHSLSSGLGILASIASTAPYVGLFGTVFGIIHAFQKIGDGGGSLEVVGPAIAEALYATAIGLAVAILSVWFYNILHKYVEQFEVDMSNSKLEVMSYVDKNRSRAGGAAPAAATSAGGA